MCKQVIIHLINCFMFFLRITISFNEASSGVACNLDSRGFHVLCKATEEAVGHVKPYSITGTLPLIRELQVRFSFPFLLCSSCIVYYILLLFAHYNLHPTLFYVVG